MLGSLGKLDCDAFQPNDTRRIRVDRLGVRGQTWIGQANTLHIGRRSSYLPPQRLRLRTRGIVEGRGVLAVLLPHTRDLVGVPKLEARTISYVAVTLLVVLFFAMSTLANLLHCPHTSGVNIVSGNTSIARFQNALSPFPPSLAPPPTYHFLFINSAPNLVACRSSRQV